MVDKPREGENPAGGPESRSTESSFASWGLPDGLDGLDLAGSIAALEALQYQASHPNTESEPGPEKPPEPPPGLFPTTPANTTQVPASEEPPPAMEMVEGILFLGGPARSEASMLEAVPSLTPGEIQRGIARLNERYQAQNRPYRIVRQEKGWQMLLRPAHRAIAERLRGEAPTLKLEGVLLETLAVVAYRQPVKRVDIDAMRGGDSTGPLRQLARMGLIRAEGSREPSYHTTPAFLKLFAIDRLEDLPRPVDLEKQ